MSVRQVYALGWNDHNIPTGMDLSSAHSAFAEVLNEIQACSSTDVVPVATCNRQEIYGFGNLQGVCDIVRRKHPQMDIKPFVKMGQPAIEHMYRVASGLDSTVLGDLEILGQFKRAFKDAKSQNGLSGYFERLANTIIQASKNIRTKTSLTSGTTSYAYAAIHLLKNSAASHRDILIIGSGDFAKSIAKNVNSYLPEARIVIVNRTVSKAQLIVDDLNNAKAEDLSTLNTELQQCDTVISAVDAREMEKVNLSGFANIKLAVDLSTTGLFSQYHDSTEFCNLKQAGALINASQKVRQASKPMAEEILQIHMHEFLQWSKIHDRKDDILKFKGEVEQMVEQCPHLSKLEGEEKKKVLNLSVKRFTDYIKQGHSTESPFFQNRYCSHTQKNHNCSGLACSIEAGEQWRCQECPQH